MIIYLVVPPLVQTLFCMIGYGIIMIWNYPALGLHTLAIIFPVLLAGLLTFTLGLYLSIFEVYIKDTGKLIG
jgi:ABC-type polysaccharide/polyol phosphate export permease